MELVAAWARLHLHELVVRVLTDDAALRWLVSSCRWLCCSSRSAVLAGLLLRRGLLRLTRWLAVPLGWQLRMLLQLLRQLGISPCSRLLHLHVTVVLIHGDRRRQAPEKTIYERNE